MLFNSTVHWWFFLVFFSILGNVLVLDINGLHKYVSRSFYLSLGSLLVAVYFSLSYNYSGFLVNNLSTFFLLNSYSFYFSFGLDSFSLGFLLLTSSLLPFIILWLWYDYSFCLRTTLINFFFLDILLKCCFCSLNLFSFFFFFEISILPMFFFLGFFSKYPRKKKAANYFVFFTLFGSFFLLSGIILIFFETGSLDIVIFSTNTNLTIFKQLIIWFFVFLGFAVKIPIFSLHLWLLEAHVESPTVGSVILAAVLLKLGAFGLVKFAIFLFPFAIYFSSPFILILTCWGAFISSLAMSQQTDFKKLIAYASIVHMNTAIVGFFLGSFCGLIGAFFILLAHGFTSAGLFFAIGLLYERCLLKQVRYPRGLANQMPFFSINFFLLILCNVSFPLSLNFLGEFFLLIGFLEKLSPLLIFFLSGAMFFNFTSNFWLFQRLIFGESSKDYFMDLSFRELVLLFFFSSVPFLLGFFPIAAWKFCFLQVSLEKLILLNF